MSNNLFTDDNPKTTLKGLGFKTPEISKQSIKLVEEYFNSRLKKQKIPGTPKNLLPTQRLNDREESIRYFANQKMTRILGLANRAKSVIKNTNNKIKQENLQASIDILENWIDKHRRGPSKKSVNNCCYHLKTDKSCRRNSDAKIFKLPRKISKKGCRHIKGFSMKSSCAAYKDCDFYDRESNQEESDNNIMDRAEFIKIAKKAKKMGVYAPEKYFHGLSYQEGLKRLDRMHDGVISKSNNPDAYSPFMTDYRDGVKIKTKLSQYTKQWNKYFPQVTNISEKAELTGVPLEILEKIFKKGCAAWRTGHRPGAGVAQWGHARVNSFLVKGKTFYTADKYLAEKIINSDKHKYQKAKNWFSSIDGLCDQRNGFTNPEFCHEKGVINLFK